MITKDTRFLIIGLGLIGGSYAMGLKKNGYHVEAIEINQLSIDYALKNGIKNMSIKVFLYTHLVL